MSTLKIAVLDSSAIIALLRKEPGADEVRKWLKRSFVSSVTIAEVMCVARRRGIPAEAERWAIKQLGLNCVGFDNTQAEVVASIYSATERKSIGLGDRACMALAIALGVPVITSDREWAECGLELDVRLFR